jgi:hypothetical protein
MSELGNATHRLESHHILNLLEDNWMYCGTSLMVTVAGDTVKAE